MGYYKDHVTKEIIEGIIARVQTGENLIDVLNSVGMSENTYYRFFYKFYPQPTITLEMAMDILHEILKKDRSFSDVIRGRGLRLSVVKKAFEEFGLPVSFRKRSPASSAAQMDTYKPGRFIKCSNCALRSQCETQVNASKCERYKADIAQRHREIQAIGKERLRQKRNRGMNKW